MNASRTDALRERFERPRLRAPNVVLIISDDQAWTDFGFMGHPVIETPNIDRLAAEGATFTRGYVPTALCRASLATLATGLYAHQHGLTGNDPTTSLEMRDRSYWDDPLYRELNAELIANIDLVPTILHATGADVPTTLPGVNLLNAVEGRTIPRAAVFGEGFSHDIADVNDPTKSLLYRWCIQDQWKLILTYDGATHRYGAVHSGRTRTPQLYDLVADPHETQNVAGAHPEVVTWLSERISRWWPIP